jgi:hypothetical protein
MGNCELSPRNYLFRSPSVRTYARLRECDPVLRMTARKLRRSDSLHQTLAHAYTVSVDRRPFGFWIAPHPPNSGLPENAEAESNEDGVVEITVTSRTRSYKKKHF